MLTDLAENQTKIIVLITLLPILGSKICNECKVGCVLCTALVLENFCVIAKTHCCLT